VPKAKKQQQFCVRLAGKPTLSKGGFRLYKMSKKELGAAMRQLDSASWQKVFEKTTSKQGKLGDYHPTAISRRTAPAPLKAAPPRRSCRRALYHGVGRDDAGMKTLKRRCDTVVAHDPHHPDASVRAKPRGKFDEVYSIYTLNVVDKAEGKKVLKGIYDALDDDGEATIAVRKDTCK
jgi:hypothetical protein